MTLKSKSKGARAGMPLHKRVATGNAPKKQGIKGRVVGR